MTRRMDRLEYHGEDPVLSVGCATCGRSYSAPISLTLASTLQHDPRKITTRHRAEMPEAIERWVREHAGHSLAWRVSFPKERV